VNSNSTAYQLERRRDSLKRARQLWVAGLVIWGVVVGWVVWGFINAVDQSDNLRLVWIAVWLIPVIVLAAGCWISHRRLKACEADLVENERHGKPHA
jgi:hypothetical protein